MPRQDVELKSSTGLYRGGRGQRFSPSRDDEIPQSMISQPASQLIHLIFAPSSSPARSLRFVVFSIIHFISIRGLINSTCSINENWKKISASPTITHIYTMYGWLWSATGAPTSPPAVTRFFLFFAFTVVVVVADKISTFPSIHLRSLHEISLVI